MTRKSFFKKLIGSITAMLTIPHLNSNAESKPLDEKHLSRLERYTLIEKMETDPAIASALDKLSDDFKLKVTSKNKEIQQHIDDLFTKINVNTNLSFWIRNTAKYGNNFVYIMSEKKKGIILTKQLINYFVEINNGINKNDYVTYHHDFENKTIFNSFEIINFTSNNYMRNFQPYCYTLLDDIIVDNSNGIKFSEKKVLKLKQGMKAGLNKLCLIHLFLLGYRDNELNDFEITL